MATPSFPQGSGIEGNFAFKTVTGAAALPTTAHWRVTDATTGEVVVDYTEGSVSAETTSGVVTRVSITVEVPGPSNVLRNASAQRELKTLTIVANKDDAREYSQDFNYYVKRTGR